jgi:cell division protein FtsW
VGVAGLSVLIVHSPERMERILAFLDPWAHRDAAGYQAIQSLTALGSGGLIGRAGMSKLFFLPQADTDFILAVIGEEMGIVGTLSVLCCFWLIARAGFGIAMGTQRPFGRLLAIGLTVLLVSQALIHAAVVTVSMPTKGIALPFVSSGGSSLVICLAATAMMVAVARSGECSRGEVETGGSPEARQC